MGTETSEVAGEEAGTEEAAARRFIESHSNSGHSLCDTVFLRAEAIPEKQMKVRLWFPPCNSQSCNLRAEMTSSYMVAVCCQNEIRVFSKSCLHSALQLETCLTC